MINQNLSAPSQKIFSPAAKRALSNQGVKIVTENDISSTLHYASTLDRLRAPIEIHNGFEELPQRFINCLTENSYVRPHMHVVPNQWELMSWLSGEIIALIFDNYGIITHKIILNQNATKLIEIPPFRYHSFYVRGAGAYLEIRNCKYQPTVDRIYAAWSPPEKSESAQAYLQKLHNAEVGDIMTL